MKAKFSKTSNSRLLRDQEKARDLLEKDNQRTANFMSQLGVDLTKGPIKIAPRIPNT